MEDFTAVGFLIALVKIIIIDLVVSGDNAMVIALASRRLPNEQRKKAIIWGTFGAIGIRVFMTVIAVYLLKVPFLQAVGGVFLLWVAVKLLVDNAGGEEELQVKEGNTLGQAIRTIIIADLILSMDNIFAVAGAAEGHIWLVLIGLAISIPVIIWGSSVILKLINRFPILVYVGAGVLGWTAGSMMVHDKMIAPYVTNVVLEYAAPVLLTAGVIGAGKWLTTRKSKHEQQTQALEA